MRDNPCSDVGHSSADMEYCISGLASGQLRHSSRHSSLFFDWRSISCYSLAIPAAPVCMQVPTTVMATVDSSVGGKTGVNHPLGKNMIGAFYQPQCVLIDTDTLITLPDRELASGISEIVKYGLIRDAPLFEWLEQNMHRLMQRDPEVLPLALVL